MTPPERSDPPPPEVGIAEAHIPVVGLRPDVYDTTGEVLTESNLTDKLSELHEAINNRPWFKQLLTEVRQGKRSAIVRTVVGGIIITVAIGAGFEFGIRHGQDIREFSKLLRRKHPQK